MNDDPIAVIFLVIAALEKIGIKYLIGGSFASSIYGEPRATRDADVLADIRAEHAQPLCELLKSEFNISNEAILGAIKHRSSFNVIHYQSLFKVDIFVPKDRRFEEQEFQRRSLQLMARNPDKQAYVASAEDVILAKLEWYQQGNLVSDQQWRDVTGIFKANQGRLDLQYLRQMADELGVLDLLQKLIQD